MIIFQTAGGNGPFSTSGGLIDSSVDDFVTTFRSNSYIHRLNRTLQAELRAVSTYGPLSARAHSQYAEACEEHQRAGKELIRLIIANRGVPEDQTPFSTGFTRAFIQICRTLPISISNRAARSTLCQLEKNLIDRYRDLLTEAPFRDAESLRQLLQSTELNRDRLTATSSIE